MIEGMAKKMKKIMIKNLLFAVLGLCCIMAFMSGSINFAKADKADIPKLGSNNISSSVTLMLGKADMVNIGGEIADVLVANPSIVDVMAVKSDRLYLVGSSIGDTNIMALDSDGNILKKVNVHVQMDTEKLQSMLNDLYPTEQVDVRALGDQIILTGDVTTPAAANKITSLVGKFASEAQGIDIARADNVIVNMLGVRGEQQVMLKVKIVEASRSALKDLGLRLNSPNGANVGSVGGGINGAPGNLGLSAPAQLATAFLNYSSGTFGNLTFLAQALEQEGIINTLAEPNLTAISGEQAGFLAGGEFPIPTQIDRNGNLIYEFKPFGVSLNFKPIVMSKERISLQLTTEVSTTSFEQNLQLNGINIPTFNVRRAETNVELPSGGTLMIAGLIKSDSISGLTQIPGIGDVPIMGDLIKSDTFKRSESEVVVMITPYLVEPFAQNQTASINPADSMNVTSTQAVTNAAPTMNYGAMVPDDRGLPRFPPEEDMGYVEMMPANKAPAVYQDKQTTEFFSDNIRRVYGQKAPENLISQKSGFGYVLE